MQSKPNNEEKQPKNNNQDKSKKSPAGKTYGNKPPIKEPKPTKKPDRYEM